MSDNQNKENGCSPCMDQNETESDQLKSGCYGKVKVEQPAEMPSISSNVGLQEWDRSNFTHTSSRAGSSSTRASSTQSLNPSSRFLSRFSLIPGNISFRLSRASSLGSSRAYPVSSSSITSHSREELQLHAGPSNSLVNRNGNQQGTGLLPVCLINRSPTSYYEDTSANIRLQPPSSVFSEDPMINTHDVNLHSTSNHVEIESTETRLADRRIGPREPVERNVRFSRTLSVGRLRDRVLRRSSVSDLTFCPLRREREVTSQGGEGQVSENETGTSGTNRNAPTSPTSSGYPLSSMSGSLFGSQDFEIETSRSREARYHDLLEHRSNFLERRRRIRSQVCELSALDNDSWVLIIIS